MMKNSNLLFKKCEASTIIINMKSKQIEGFAFTLKNDYAFKRLLGVEENKAILQDFLECVLDLDPSEIAGLELLDKELKKEHAEDRTGILDIQVRLKDGMLIDVEMQLVWDASFVARALFYWSKMYTRDFKSGDHYSSLRKCISINIIGEGYNLDDELHSKNIIMNPKNQVEFPNFMELHFLNLEKVKGTLISNEGTKENRLANWLKFIDTTNQKERNMLAATSPVLAILNEQVGKINLSPEEERLYESRMKLRSDIVSIQESSFNIGIQKGIEQGIEKGREEGREEGSHSKAIETAKKCLKMKMSVETIMELTGLSEDEIEKLK